MRLFRRQIGVKEKDGTAYSYLERLDKVPDTKSLPDLTHPVVFFLPGYQTIETAAESRKTIDQKTSVLERRMGGLSMYDKDTQFYAVAYSDNTHKVLVKPARFANERKWLEYSPIAKEIFHSPDKVGRFRNILLYKIWPNYYASGNARRFANEFILPALHLPEGMLESSDLPGIKETLRHVTLIGDSYGGIFAQEIGNYLDTVLKKKGVSDPEMRADVLQSIVLVAVPSVLKDKPDHFTTIHFVGNNDRTRDFVRNTNGSPRKFRAKLGELVQNYRLTEGERMGLAEAMGEKRESRPLRLDVHAHEAKLSFDPAVNFELKVTYHKPKGKKQKDVMHVANPEFHDTFSYITAAGEEYAGHIDYLEQVLRSAIHRDTMQDVSAAELLGVAHAPEVAALDASIHRGSGVAMPLVPAADKGRDIMPG